ncbi:MAG TPA: hypothetical protein VJS44_18120 [Pyrinomonadaceae bacterium]|nr:hypothetical protein [Pyrinomonadaceae bacterium]
MKGENYRLKAGGLPRESLQLPVETLGLPDETFRPQRESIGLFDKSARLFRQNPHISRIFLFRQNDEFFFCL